MISKLKIYSKLIISYFITLKNNRKYELLLCIKLNFLDKHYGLETVYPQGVEQMQREIYNNGPIAVYIMVKQDLMKYTKGIYYADPASKEVGGHFVRAIGWGSENGVPYWLLANSWGKCWGEGRFLN